MLRAHYAPPGNEIDEDDLIVPGEAPDSDDEADDVPIRILDNFSVFHQTTREYIPALRLLTEDVCEDWVATGYVHPHFGDTSTPDNDGEAASPLVQLSTLLECNAHWPTKAGRSYHLDRSDLRNDYWPPF